MNSENNGFENSRIERLKRALYSRNEALVPKEKMTPVSPRNISVPENWGTPKSFDIKPDEMVKHNNSFFNKFLIGSLIFFLLSLGVALFIFFGGINMISSNNLDVKVVAPSSISSGEEFLVALTIVNGNRTDLEDVVLVIDYPTGSESVTETNKLLSHDRIELGTIEKGGTKDYSIRAFLFGEKDSIKTFILKLEYKVKGSNATFSKEKTVDVSIGSSPVLMEVIYPKEVNSGQEVTMVVNVTSNASVLMKNSIVKIEYPYGYTYKSSSIKPVRDNSIWNIGDLQNGESKKLSVTGVLVGQNMEDRSFRVSIGSQTPGSIGDFDSDLAESSITIGIRKSFFDLSVSTTGDGVKRIGEYVPVMINWHNTLPDKILNSRIEAKLSGNILDRNNVNVESRGFYESVNNSVVWDKNSNDVLATLMPGADGRVSFTLISLTDPAVVRAIKNPHLDVRVVMTGTRSDADSSVVSSTEDITIKIESTMNLTSKSLRLSGPFNNTGPIPPKADTESTYTIAWTVTNTTNDLKDSSVVATLPVGVSWKGETSPSSERISYNPDSRTVTWNIGNISSGVGFTYSPKTVSFKVGIVPSINQSGSTPVLVSKATASATDTYTNTTITSDAANVTTQYSEPEYKSTDGIVVK